MEHDTRVRFDNLDGERNIATERHLLLLQTGYKTLKMINSSRLILELTWSKLDLHVCVCVCVLGWGGG